MKNIVVIYKSKYGSTKKYAKWISEHLNSDLFEASEIESKKLLKYDTIIFGGGLYASGISGVSLITKNFKSISDKNIIVFTVGLAATEDKGIFKPIIEKNIPAEIRSSICYFHFRGGIDYSKLNTVHKAMMAMLKKMVAKKNPEEQTDEDRKMLQTYGDNVDFADEKSIDPLVTYVNNL